MDREEHRDRAYKFIQEILKEFPENKQRDLSEALYTFSELGLFEMDIEINEVKPALIIWALVETARRKGFPSELRM